MKTAKRKNRQNIKACLTCGNDVDPGCPHKPYCCLRCWGEDHGEEPEDTHDKIVPFDGYGVGQ